MQNVKLRREKSGGEEIKKFTGCLEVPGQARNALIVLLFEGVFPGIQSIFQEDTAEIASKLAWAPIPILQSVFELRS
jgi:hypothetical protein